MHDKTIYKRAISDGYFKIFDMFGHMPFGRTKYKDMRHEGMMFYYKILGLTMMISFGLVMGSILLIAYSVTENALISTPIALTIFLLVYSPLIFQFLKGIKELFDE